jgi:glycolate oxidase FAD binding subunit
VAFADEVGTEGPVAVAGGRTQWAVGGELDPSARVVRAPSAVLDVQPAEMTVRVLAGTAVAELQAALREVGQTVNLPDFGGTATGDGSTPRGSTAGGSTAGGSTAGGSTVGGVLAVGRSGLRRLGWGPVRDALLQVRYVSAEGLVVTGGGPTVKNVTGFDLPRLLVGSLGTLGLLGEVVLRTRPLPQAERWLAGAVDPFELRNRLARPVALLWDGETSWVLLAGHRGDVEAESVVASAAGMREVEGPPPLPPHRRSCRPGELRELGVGAAAAQRGRFVAEIGVGVVHADSPAPPRALEPAVAALHGRIKTTFDPTFRLNPGRDPALR